MTEKRFYLVFFITLSRFVINSIAGSSLFFLFLLIFNDGMTNGILPRHGIVLFFTTTLIAVTVINILLEIGTMRDLYRKL